MNKQIIMLGMVTVACLSVISTGAFPGNKKNQDFIVRHYMLSGGLQYGIGAPLSNSYSNPLDIRFRYSHNTNTYLRLNISRMSLFAGLRFTSFQFNRHLLNQDIRLRYEQQGYKVSEEVLGSSFDIITPYFGFAYVFRYKSLRLEPLIRFGLGISNYAIAPVYLTPDQSGKPSRTVYFIDSRPNLFVNNSLGINVSKRLSNFIKFNVTAGLDLGNPGKAEIIEETNEASFYTIRKRNLYLQHNATQFYLMAGFEFTPFNKIYADEKRYERLRSNMKN